MRASRRAGGVTMNRRVIQWLVPFLYGLGLGIFIAWTVGIWLPFRGGVAYLSFFAVALVLLATFIRVYTGYRWPWEGPGEWSDTPEIATRQFVRNFVVWIVVVIVLLVIFTLRQPGFR